MNHFHRTASCKIPEQKCHNDILLHFDSRAENNAVLHLSDEDPNQRSKRKGPTTASTFNTSTSDIETIETTTPTGTCLLLAFSHLTFHYRGILIHFLVRRI